MAPASLQRSSTATARVVAGSMATKRSPANGRNKRTFTTPTASPAACKAATVSAAVSQPEPISTSTRSARGEPTYSTSPYWRPVSAAKRSIASCTSCGTDATNGFTVSRPWK